MLELAEHIIKTKRGSFDPAKYDDRYEEALADLVKAKLEGREIKPSKAPAPSNVVNLLDALRESAGVKKAKARSEEHTYELQSLMRISYAVFCLKKKNTNTIHY